MHELGSVDGQNILDSAQTAAEDLLASAPDMDLIYATGEPAMIGALSALQTSPPRRTVHLAGWDMSPEIDRGLREGIVLATAVQDTVRMGEAAVDAAHDWLHDMKVPHDITVPATIVTLHTHRIRDRAAMTGGSTTPAVEMRGITRRFGAIMPLRGA
jgi:ribose transport system substrate-binding protein